METTASHFEQRSDQWLKTSSEVELMETLSSSQQGHIRELKTSSEVELMETLLEFYAILSCIEVENFFAS